MSLQHWRQIWRTEEENSKAPLADILQMGLLFISQRLYDHVLDRDAA
jgi:hypothetical protein